MQHIAFLLCTGESEDFGSEYIPQPSDDETSSSEDNSSYTDISCKYIHIINIVGCFGGEFIIS
jgi:hypothetical protein